jgi:glycosyltransferase involved in cell wall biosynthesis
MPGLPSLLYASPFPPQRSGVSSYSRQLVDELSRFFRVTLLTGGIGVDVQDLQPHFPVLRYGEDALDFAAFDHVLYNVGNNPAYHSYIYDAFIHHPAPIILHDVVLYYLTVGFYRNHPGFYSRLYQLGGAPAVAAVKDARKENADLLFLPQAHQLPLNAEFLYNAPRVFVHSRYARDRIRPARRGPIHCIPMPAPATRPGNPGYLRSHHGIPDDALVIGSFGVIAPTKQNHVTCEALPGLQKFTSRPIYHVLVGSGDSADAYLGPRIIRTGYLDDGDYGAVLNRCDLVVNLRHPTMGETSISLIHAMAAGKGCVVSDHAWFSELPNDVVVKIPHRDPVHELIAVLEPLLTHPEDLVELGSRARAHITRHHSPCRTAEEIARALMSSTPHEMDG